MRRGVLQRLCKRKQNTCDHSDGQRKKADSNIGTETVALEREDTLNNLPVEQFKTSSKKATVKFERNLKIETSLRTTLYQKATAMVMISPALSAA